MKKHFLNRFVRLLSIIVLVSTYSVLIAARTETRTLQNEEDNQQKTELSEKDSEKGSDIDWMQLIISVGYIGGVFVLLPIILYTNNKEKLLKHNDLDEDQVNVVNDLSEEQRNQKSAEILEKIESELTPFESEDGTGMVTITKGKQAKQMKFGLDYINKRLSPTENKIKARLMEFEELYNERIKRVYTGSNIIIGCGIGVGAFMVFTGGVNTFIFIHGLGLIFYYLSSRTNFYRLEKRIKYFGNGSGFLSSIMSGLFIGNGTKYYAKRGSGSWYRDWEMEGMASILKLFIFIILGLILGFIAAFLGVINFILNYVGTILLPFKTLDQRYEKYFS